MTIGAAIIKGGMKIDRAGTDRVIMHLCTRRAPSTCGLNFAYRWLIDSNLAGYRSFGSINIENHVIPTRTVPSEDGEINLYLEYYGNGKGYGDLETL